jgi:hypothetical protein
MSREEIQKLLGGYATNTLSEAERRVLFEAALEDQELFDELAKEEALREVLQDPSARQQLIVALGPAREPFAARAWQWLHRPAALARAGGVAALLIVAGLVLHQTKHARPEAMVTDAISPRPPAPVAALAPSLAPQETKKSPVVGRQLRRLAPLPAPPALAAPQPVTQREVAEGKLSAAPAAPPRQQPAPMATGALGGPAQANGQDVQVQMQSQTVVAQDRPLTSGIARAKVARPAAARLAVEYTLLLKDAGGVYTPVPSGTVFHAGDSVRLQVAPSEAGYIYLFQRNATAGWNLVAGQRVEKAQRYALPSTGALLSDQPAQRELLLVLSRLEQTAFAAPQTSDIDALAAGASSLSAAATAPADFSAHLVDTRQAVGVPQASFKITIEYR